MKQASDSRDLYARRELCAIAQRWDRRAQDWDNRLLDPACHLNEDHAYTRFLRVVEAIVGRRRRFCARHGVIDAGCGTGLVLASISSSFAWAMGVDLSPRMVELARQKSTGITRYLVGDCFNLPSLCPKAGAVLSRGVLLSHYGMRHGLALLQAARATLVRGGFIVFDFLNDEGRMRSRHRPDDKTFLTTEQALELADKAGFVRSRVLGQRHRRVLLLFSQCD